MISPLVFALQMAELVWKLKLYPPYKLYTLNKAQDEV